MNERRITSLESIPAGTGARMIELRLSPAESQRLMEMGMTSGTTLTVLKRAPLGDPIEILVRGGHLSIRKTVAEAIIVEPIDGGASA